MGQTIAAEKITLYDLEKKIQLSLVENQQFFREWQEGLLELTNKEKEHLKRVKASYFNLAKRPMLEDIVKMVVLSPLLDLAGFYLPPFYMTSEKTVEIIAEDEGEVVKGKIDVLVLQDQFWVLVIESKRVQFSLEAGIPQALAYMLANPQPEKPLFGLVTNGSNFIFIKLIQQAQPLYALSNEFTLRRENDLDTVLAILKRFSELFIHEN